MLKLSCLGVRSFSRFNASGQKFDRFSGSRPGDSPRILTSNSSSAFYDITRSCSLWRLVRSRNVLSVFMHCIAVACLMSILWVLLGYSISVKIQAHILVVFLKVFLNGITS